jgi:hypothetical protein
MSSSCSTNRCGPASAPRDAEAQRRRPVRSDDRVHHSGVCWRLELRYDDDRARGKQSPDDDPVGSRAGGADRKPCRFRASNCRGGIDARFVSGRPFMRSPVSLRRTDRIDCLLRGPVEDGIGDGDPDRRW